MDYLGALKLFVRAVELGSFSKASADANAKTSTVSRAIASLEEDLGVALFHRSTRRVHLTEPGATFYEHARSILRSLDEARGAASAAEGRPQGLIHLHVPSAFARLHIMPFVPEFLATYPDVRLDVSFADVRVDLLAVGADFAIRIGPQIDFLHDRPQARAQPPHRLRQPGLSQPRARNRRAVRSAPARLSSLYAAADRPRLLPQRRRGKRTLGGSAGDGPLPLGTIPKRSAPPPSRAWAWLSCRLG